MSDPNSTFYYYPPNSNPQPQFTQPYATPFPVIAPPPVYGGLWAPEAPEQAVSNYSISNAIPPVASPNPQQIKSWSSYYSGSNALKRKMKSIQSVRCEICDVFCNSIELYEKHLSGKKHLKTLKQKYASQTSETTPSQILQPVSQPNVNSSTSEDHLAGKIHGVQAISNTTERRNVMDGASSSAVDEGLEVKKQKLAENGVAEESAPLCNSGIAVSTSAVACADHSAGVNNIIQVATTTMTSASPGEDLGTKKQKLIQSGVPKGSVRVCTVCNVVCNSEVVYADHIVGKKHITQAQKAAGVCNPNQNQSIPQAAKVLPENIDSKRLKILGNGAPATSVRVCALCNVVCNSDSVFKSHLSGQKHASMIKKMNPH